MITYERNNLATYKPTGNQIYIYFNAVFKNNKFDNTWEVLYDRSYVDDFRNEYVRAINSMDYTNGPDVVKQLNFIHLIPFRGSWLPRYLCCVSCVESVDFFDDIYYTFETEQLERQLMYIKGVMRSLENAVLLIPYCADNKVPKSGWSNVFLPAILKTFASSEEKCAIISPLENEWL